jgi:hypothetical protein
MSDANEHEHENDDKNTYLQLKEEIGSLTSMMQRIINLEDYKGKDKMVKQYTDLINDKLYQYQTKIKKIQKKNEIHQQQEESVHFG